MSIVNTVKKVFKTQFMKKFDKKLKTAILTIALFVSLIVSFNIMSILAFITLLSLLSYSLIAIFHAFNFLANNFWIFYIGFIAQFVFLATLKVSSRISIKKGGGKGN